MHFWTRDEILGLMEKMRSVSQPSVGGSEVPEMAVLGHIWVKKSYWAIWRLSSAPRWELSLGRCVQNEKCHLLKLVS